MLNLRRKIVPVSSDTALVCAQLQVTGCSCNCALCNNCTDCTNCPSLTISDIVMKVYRKGTEYVCNNNIPAPGQFPNCQAPYPPNCATAYYPNVPPNPTYFVQYNAYSLTGITVCFYIDSLLTGACSGRYVGDVFIKDNKANGVEMQVGDTFKVFEPYSVSLGGGINDDLQP